MRSILMCLLCHIPTVLCSFVHSNALVGVLMGDPLLQCPEDKILDNIIEDPLGLGFTCGLCGRGFGSDKGHCKRHIKNVHSKTTTSLACDFCQKSYKNYDTLKAHQRATHGVYVNK